MGFHKTVLWIVLAGLIALIVVTVYVEEPLFRVFLAILAVTPMIYVAIRVAIGSEHRLAKERRKYLKLRVVTEEFLMHVRNLNRLKVAAAQFETQPPIELDTQIGEVVERMHGLVDRMRETAGEVVPHPPGFIPGSGEETGPS